MAKSKKMTLDFLSKDGQSYDKLKKITFENGMYTEIYEKFSNQRIDEMFADFSKFLDEYNKRVDLEKMTDEKMMDYINLYILKWFSTLIDRKTYSFEETVLVYKNVLKSGYSEYIFEQFDKSETQKVYDRMFKKLETLQEVMKQNVDVRNEIKKTIQESGLENEKEIMSVYFPEEVVGQDGDIQGS